MNKAIQYLKEGLAEWMFSMVLLDHIIFSFIGEVIVDIFVANQVFGYRLSFRDGAYYMEIIILVFLVGYLFLNLAKIKTNLLISVIHLILICLSSLLYSFWELDLRILLSLYGVSIVVFGWNVYDALSNRKKK